MRVELAILISAAVLIGARTASAQTEKNGDDHLIARLSYGNTLMEYSDGAPRRVCFAVYKSGLYRLWRPNTMDLKPGDPDPARIVSQGALTQEEMRQLTTMLRQLNFKSQGGGIVEQGSESFLAELIQNGRTERLKWVDPDHRRPFPQVISRIVDWMQDFEPRNSRQITLQDLSNVSVCPSANDNPLPLTAGLSSFGR